ncbi:hypothetical protein D3C71_2074780 [compost metagenome]
MKYFLKDQRQNEDYAEHDGVLNRRNDERHRKYGMPTQQPVTNQRFFFDIFSLNEANQRNGA